MKIIDVNASAGFWPVQEHSFGSLEALHQAFEQLNVSDVLISAIESILAPEPDRGDLRLFEKLVRFPRFRAVKTVNPILANWERTAGEAASNHSVAAIKLFPNYHAYSLQSTSVERVCRFALDNRIPVLVQMRVNDERNQPPFLQVASVGAADISELSRRFPENTIIALCAYNSELKELAGGSSRLLVDTAFLDGVAPFGEIEPAMAESRFVFGSHAPFLYPDAAALKLRHNTLSESSRRGMAAGNFLSWGGVPSTGEKPGPFAAR